MGAESRVPARPVRDSLSRCLRERRPVISETGRETRVRLRARLPTAVGVVFRFRPKKGKTVFLVVTTPVETEN